MSKVPFQSPVQDSVPKVNEEVAVGEDLEFQRKWWKFENLVWVIYGVLLIATMAGVFGRGPLAKAQAKNSALNVHYERVERTGTPSILRIDFDPSAIQNGKVHLFVSDSIVKELGAQRIVPQPESSVIGQAGITYTFAATTTPASVEFALEPSGPGAFHFSVSDPDLPSAQAISSRVIVVP